MAVARACNRCQPRRAFAFLSSSISERNDTRDTVGHPRQESFVRGTKNFPSHYAMSLPGTCYNTIASWTLCDEHRLRAGGRQSVYNRTASAEWPVLPCTCIQELVCGGMSLRALALFPKSAPPCSQLPLSASARHGPILATVSTVILLIASCSFVLISYTSSLAFASAGKRMAPGMTILASSWARSSFTSMGLW